MHTHTPHTAHTLHTHTHTMHTHTPHTAHTRTTHGTHTMHTHTHTPPYAHTPHTPGVPFPRNFITIAKTILKRLFRVYAHIYHAHFDDIIQLQEEVGAIVLSVA